MVKNKFYIIVALCLAQLILLSSNVFATDAACNLDAEYARSSVFKHVKHQARRDRTVDYDAACYQVSSKAKDKCGASLEQQHSLCSYISDEILIAAKQECVNCNDRCASLYATTLIPDKSATCP